MNYTFLFTSAAKPGNDNGVRTLAVMASRNYAINLSPSGCQVKYRLSISVLLNYKSIIFFLFGTLSERPAIFLLIEYGADVICYLGRFGLLSRKLGEGVNPINQKKQRQKKRINYNVASRNEIIPSAFSKMRKCGYVTINSSITLSALVLLIPQSC